ncbi:hypothetical protein [Sporolactobacillus inulinus]|jgi:hypothetical protein|uniref:DUF1453 domain-containing protein n=1 Tax=Sporolactobacillus inulinus CASD TaxID=1069536 RepID=A0A0U1QKN4_9BACL|nr:hypothetical protein [Sporolactobacillus inulinus]KLI01364.1 hypothetical protein SINU_13815 [Sporolactobacillus inulinus CASD]
MFFILGTLLIAAVFFNQLREKPLTAKLYRQPLALLLCAGLSLSTMHPLPLIDWCMMIATLGFSFILGLIQGRYTPLLNRDGAWYLAGSLISVFVWFLSIPIRSILKFMSIHYLALTPSLNGSSSFIIYFIFIAGFLFGRYSMLLLRYPSLLKNVEKNEQKLKRLRSAR